MIRVYVITTTTDDADVYVQEILRSMKGTEGVAVQMPVKKRERKMKDRVSATEVMARMDADLRAQEFAERIHEHGEKDA